MCDYLAKWGRDQSSAQDDVDNPAQYTAVTIRQKKVQFP